MSKIHDENDRTACDAIRARIKKKKIKHIKGCMQPQLNIIKKIDNGYFIDLPDAPKKGLNQVYYCPTCGVCLGGIE